MQICLNDLINNNYQLKINQKKLALITRTLLFIINENFIKHLHEIIYGNAWLQT